MNKFVRRGWTLAVGGMLLLAGCSKDADTPKPNPEPEPEPTKKVWYVVQTSSQLSNPQRPGNIKVFDEFPSGNISTTTEPTLQGLGMAGWRPYDNWILKMFDTKNYDNGIERIKISKEGKIEIDQFLKADGSVNGSGNFVIADEETGFYWDAESPLAIQRFNPTTLARVAGEIDLTEAVNERGQDEEGIKFRSVGQKFLAVKNGKLFANITYAKTDGTQKGFWDDFYPDVYIAVIDIATGKWEKTTKIEGTGAIAYINDNRMYSFDTNGDLYIVCQGGNGTALGGNSKIVRIKADATDIDTTWELDMDQLRPDYKAKFVNVFAKDGKLVTTINNTALIGGPQGNINLSDIWEYYIVDVATKALTPVTGIPPVTNPGGAFGAVEIDGKVYIRVVTANERHNGYYELNGTTAVETFNVTEGGMVQGIYKIEVE